MPAYPEWVNQYRERGTSVKKVGNTYYLYKTRSVRIPGKKNPQPQSEYIGIITPQGVERTGVKKLETKVIRVYEYGFSYAMKTLMPDKMVRDLGDAKRAEGILQHIVYPYSQTSYLLRGKPLPAKDDLHTCVSTQKKKFERLAGLVLEDLLPLQHIYLVEIGGQDLISEITPELKMLLEKVGVAI
jgi:hypothetical protein